MAELVVVKCANPYIRDTYSEPADAWVMHGALIVDTKECRAYYAPGGWVSARYDKPLKKLDE